MIAMAYNISENIRSSLESELQQIKTSSTSSSAEVDSLKVRISTLEAANRDTLTLLDSKASANDSLAQDLQRQHQKGLELGQQLTKVQQELQNAESSISISKFKQQSLTQELEQARRNNDWLEQELKTKSAEALKFRKEKGARIAELQRLNEDANASVEALKKTETALRARLDEVQSKAEESWSKVQQLQEAAASAEESFRQELESSRRLADLRAQQTETHKNRLAEVEESVEKYKESAAEQINELEQEVEAERQERAALENRITELEANIDQLEAAATQPQASVPGTPRASFNGRQSSPFGTPATIRGKSSITATQALDELYKVRGQLATEKRRNEKLTAEMDEMLQSLEAKQPEIEELHAEHTRLQQEVVEMSKFVDHSGKEAERAKKEVRRAESEAATARAETVILTQQLRDLSIQVKMLLMDLDARERGLENLSIAERRQIERIAQGESDEGAFEGLTDTDRFISQRLTVFRSISELQEKNQELLKITRELSAQMESDEALAAKHEAANDHEQVQVLQQKIENYKDELQSMVVRSESYIKERDMFRRMLQHRGQLPAQSDMGSMFAQSVDGNGILNSVEQTPSKQEAQATALALRELQRHFDQYREEGAIDRRTLKEQAEKLSAEKSSLQAELAKTSSQLTLANERFEMLNANYAMLKTENSELQKRSQLLSESAAKQDLRIQQASEDLIEANSVVESLRNEKANLMAEKKLWKDIQDRLNQENQDLLNERNRLNGVIAAQQTMQNEREMSEREDRRRAQAQVEGLEKELQTTKRKLNDETEENKRLREQKEYDALQVQKRIDGLAATLSSLREELAVAKNTRDNLQARVDDLTIKLKSAEEHVEVLQPRPTPRPGTHAATGSQAVEDTLSREQELAIEASEAKRDLELARGELESMRAQVEQYREISQASEEQLASSNETHALYEEEMERIIGEKDTRIRELEQRIEDINTELSTANTELNSMRDQQSEVARRFADEKASLEVEIVRLRDEDEKHATAAQFHQQDLRAQAEIATKAQQDYEQELVKHAAAASMLQNLRAEYNMLKTESTQLKSEAESSRVALNQNQSSWEERKDQFEKELDELRARKDDIAAQNKVLLQQLENVTAQVTELQQSRVASSQNAENTTPSDTVDRSLEGLRELVTYLRRDKEIVDVQYELSMQEAKRLRQQLEYTQSQLDEARLKLDQERRQQADGSRNNIAHKDLMEKLNELNLYRESSITLRNEARQAQAQLDDEKKTVEELRSKIEPLEAKIRELENGKDMQDGEIRLLQEDRDRWQKRNQEILSKYDRIDPAEMEQLKQTVATLQAERDAMEAESRPLQEQITNLEAEKSKWGESRQKIIDQAKERSRKDTKEKNERAAERDQAIQEKELFAQQLTELRDELQKAISEKESIASQLTTTQQELAAARSQAAPDSSTVAEPATVEVTEQLNAVREELNLLKAESSTVSQKLAHAIQELETAKQERDEALAAAAEAKAALTANSTTATENGIEEGQITDDNRPALADAERKALEERVAQAEAKATEAAAKAQQLEDSKDATLKERSEKMKAALNLKLRESRDAARAALEEEFKAKLEQERQNWLTENAAKTAPKPEAAQQAPPTTAEAATVTVAPSTPASTQPTSNQPSLSALSETQLKDFLAKSDVAKAILTNNIRKKLEAETKKLKDEHEKTVAEKLAEANKKAEELKTNAVNMESKRYTLKMNMAENKLRLSDFKIEIVKKAASETPDKPVVQVWEIAKDAKPPPGKSS